MGADIKDQTRPLTEEERQYTSRMLKEQYERIFPEIISNLNGKHDPGRFGIETEYHCVDQNCNVIPNGAKEVIKRYSEVVGDCADFMLELNSSPFQVIDEGSSLCLEELTHKEEKMRQAVIDAHGTQPVPIGIIPTFSTDMTLLDFIPERQRAKLINPYIMDFMKDDDLIFTEKGTGFKINYGKMPSGGLMNSLHISVSGKDDRQSAMLYNLANALCAPMIALAANSSVVDGKITTCEDAHLFVYEQNKEIVNGVPRVGNVPFYLDSLHDNFRAMLEFNPIFGYNEKDPLGSIHNHFSSTWPWIRAQVNNFYRVEFRPIPKQPTLSEDMAVSTVYLYGLLALEEEHRGIVDSDHSIREYCNKELFPEGHLIANTQSAAMGGYEAPINWKGKMTTAGEALKEVYHKGLDYARNHGVSKENIDIMRIAEPRIYNAMNPARRFRAEVERLGFDDAMQRYYEHTIDRRDTPYIR